MLQTPLFLNGHGSLGAIPAIDGYLVVGRFVGNRVGAADGGTNPKSVGAAVVFVPPPQKQHNTLATSATESYWPHTLGERYESVTDWPWAFVTKKNVPYEAHGLLYRSSWPRSLSRQITPQSVQSPCGHVAGTSHTAFRAVGHGSVVVIPSSRVGSRDGAIDGRPVGGFVSGSACHRKAKPEPRTLLSEVICMNRLPDVEPTTPGIAVPVKLPSEGAVAEDPSNTLT